MENSFIEFFNYVKLWKLILLVAYDTARYLDNPWIYEDKRSFRSLFRFILVHR